jgi:hypothetical protein
VCLQIKQEGSAPGKSFVVAVCLQIKQEGSAPGKSFDSCLCVCLQIKQEGSAPGKSFDSWLCVCLQIKQEGSAPGKSFKWPQNYTTYKELIEDFIERKQRVVHLPSLMIMTYQLTW